MSYKRNQLEEAISAVVEPRAKQQPSPSLRVRIKRLLEADRALELKPRSPDPLLSQFAFFSEGSPGKGVEVRFSEYEVFAVCVALLLFAHGWTPSVVASIMRGARRELEVQHARVLDLCRSDKAYRWDNASSPYLAVIIGTTVDGAEEDHVYSVRRNFKEASEWIAAGNDINRGFAMFILAPSAQHTYQKLQKTEPRPRGPQG